MFLHSNSFRKKQNFHNLYLISIADIKENEVLKEQNHKTASKGENSSYQWLHNKIPQNLVT
jgi:hypothetical protein